MSGGGSQQLRRFRIAMRDGAAVEDAAREAGIEIAEARLIAAEDAKNPPGPEAYVLLGLNSKEVPMPPQEPTNPATLPLASIRPGGNPRRYFDRRKHEELVSSMRLRGMLQPMLVRPAADEPGVFALVAGERRYKAALEAFGADGAAPVTIREMTDQEALEAAIDENDCRDDASETEQADAAVRVLAACQNDRAEAARRLGWSAAKLERRLALANLSEAVKNALDERRIKVGHAELLAAVPADKQDTALATILSAGLDVNKTRELLMRVTQDLAKAKFDKTECAACPFNSSSQSALFATHVDDGHCTNAPCFQLKADAADAAAAPRQEEQPPAAVTAEAEPQPAVAGDDPGSQAAPAEAPAPASPKAKLSPAAPAPAPARVPTVTAQSIAGRLADLREAAWRTALARTLASNPEHARSTILVAAMSGTLSHIRDVTLTSRAEPLVGAGFGELDYAAKIAAVRALPDAKATNAFSAIGAAYAKDVRGFAHVAELARAFEVDLRATWRVDHPFLDRCNTDELKFIAQECGLVAHMGEGPFAKLLKSKRADLIAGVLNATGFDWSGHLPSAMTLDGQYSPPPTTADPQPLAAEAAA